MKPNQEPPESSAVFSPQSAVRSPYHIKKHMIQSPAELVVRVYRYSAKFAE